MLAQYIAARCVVATDKKAKKRNLYEDFRRWCSDHAEAMTPTNFTLRLADREIELDKGRRWYKGIGLIDGGTE